MSSPAENATVAMLRRPPQARRSGIREIVELVRGRSDILPLHSGEPDHSVPVHIFDAVARVADKPARYGPGAGIAELREAMSAKLISVNGIAAAVDDVVVTHGAVQGCAAVFDTVLTEGDEVLVPSISYPNYALLAERRGARIRRYSLDLTDGYRPDLASIEALVRDRTRIIVVNSPANPTGAMLNAQTVTDLVGLVERHDVLLLSDEVYEEIYFDQPPTSPAAISAENVVTLFSLSKTYAMTGWRVGYLHAPSWLSKALVTVQESTLGGVSTVTQLAALAALTGPQDGIGWMRAQYRRRAELLANRVRALSPEFQAPAGGYCAMVPHGRRSSREAAYELIDRGVATIPGSAFGPDGDGLLRVSFCIPDEVLEEGLDRFSEWFVEHR